jgi:serine/threonine protein kinase/tetratricopeptide (TPR) repeat protein
MRGAVAAKAAKTLFDNEMARVAKLCRHEKLSEDFALQEQRAMQSVGAGEYERALTLLRMCLEKYETSGVLDCRYCGKRCRARYCSLLGGCGKALYSLGEYSEAYNVLFLCYELTIHCGGDTLWLDGLMADSCRQVGRKKDALQFYMRVVATESDPAVVDAAVDMMDSFLESMPLFYFGGTCHFFLDYWQRSGDVQRSQYWKDKLKGLVNVTLEDILDIRRDGKAFFAEGNFGLALDKFSLALQLHRQLNGFFCKGYVSMLSLMGQCWMKLENYNAAREVFAWCLDIHGYMGLSKLWMSHHLASSLFRAGKAEQSIQHFLECAVLAKEAMNEPKVLLSAINFLESALTQVIGRQGYLDEDHIDACQFVLRNLQDEERVERLRKLAGPVYAACTAVAKLKHQHLGAPKKRVVKEVDAPQLTGEELERADTEARRNAEELLQGEKVARNGKKGKTSGQHQQNSSKKNKSKKKRNKAKKKEKGIPDQVSQTVGVKSVDVREGGDESAPAIESNTKETLELEVVDEAAADDNLDENSGSLVSGEQVIVVVDDVAEDEVSLESNAVEVEDDGGCAHWASDDIGSDGGGDEGGGGMKRQAGTVLGTDSQGGAGSRRNLVEVWDLADHGGRAVMRETGDLVAWSTWNLPVDCVQPHRAVDGRTVTENGAERVGRLTIHNNDPLGKGASGVVTTGMFDGVRVAVKCLFVEDEKSKKLVDAEVKALRIGDMHPNVVRYLGREDDKRRVFLILELCEVDLEKFVTDREKWGTHVLFGDWVTVVKQICEGVAFLHKGKVLHRDLKPGNILIHQAGVIKISDFGLAKVVTSEMSSVKEIGTRGWRAPEVVKSNQRTMAAADVFSVGLICYFVFSAGRHPFGVSPDEREKNIIKKGKLIFRPLDDHLMHDFVKMLLKRAPGDRASINDKLLQHPVFDSWLGRLNFLTTLLHNNVEFCRGQDCSDWRAVIPMDLRDCLRVRFSNTLDSLLYVVRTLQQHFNDGSDIACFFEEHFQTKPGTVTQEDVMQYVHKIFPDLLGRCFSLALAHDLKFK